MGNCLKSFDSDDILDSESQSNQLSYESIPSLDQEFSVDLPAAHRSSAENPWIQAELARIQRLRCGRCLPIDTYVFSQAAAQGNPQECAICLSDFLVGDHIRCLPCKHSFHMDCIGQWLVLSYTCPCCRLPCHAVE